jgi:hypothetical protein
VDILLSHALLGLSFSMINAGMEHGLDLSEILSPAHFST